MLDWLFFYPKKKQFLTENTNNDTFQLLHPFLDCFGAERLKNDNIRVFIAQDIDDKTKTILFDSDKLLSNEIHHLESMKTKKCKEEIKNNFSNISLFNLNRMASPKQTISAEMISDLMFGSVPLMFQGTITKLHPLFSSETSSNSFLLTKLFTINSDFSLSRCNSNNSSVVSWSNSSTDILLNDLSLDDMTSYDETDKDFSFSCKNSGILFTLSELNSSWESQSLTVNQPKKSSMNFSKEEKVCSVSSKSSRLYVYGIGIVITLNSDLHDGCQIINQYWSILNNAADSLQRSVFLVISKNLKNINNRLHLNSVMSNPGKKIQVNIYETNRKNSTISEMSLYNEAIVYAVSKFKERILTAFSTPLVIHIPKRTNQRFKNEFKTLFKEIDNKRCKFFFSILLTAILSGYIEITSDFLFQDLTEILSGKKLENIVIIGNDVSLARRIIYVLSGLIFHDLSNTQIIDHLWPAEGLLCLSKNRLRSYKSKEFSSSKQVFEWDIPYSCPLSKGTTRSSSPLTLDNKATPAPTSDYSFTNKALYITPNDGDDNDDVTESLTKVSAKLNDKGIVEIDLLNTITEFENSSQVIDLDFHSTSYITGYMDSINFDFILQACPPSINIELQIQNQLKERCMDIDESSYDFKSSGDIVSILVADLSDWAIKKFTLRRYTNLLTLGVDAKIKKIHNKHHIFSETLTCIDNNLIENIHNYILVS